MARWENPKKIGIVDVNTCGLLTHNKIRKIQSTKNDRQINENALYFSEHFLHQIYIGSW